MMLWHEEAGARYMYYVLSLVRLLEMIHPLPLLACARASPLTGSPEDEHRRAVLASTAAVTECDTLKSERDNFRAEQA